MFNSYYNRAIIGLPFVMLILLGNAHQGDSLLGEFEKVAKF